MATVKFHATINEEGASNTKRGKIPSGLINALGGKKGDMIEFEVTGKVMTGGRIIRGREAEAARGMVFTQSKPAQSAARRAPAKVTAPVKPTRPTRPVASKQPTRPTRPVAPVAKKAVAPNALANAAKKVAGNGKTVAKVAPKKVASPTPKPSGRKTSVAYETPATKGKAGSGKPKFSLTK